MASDMIKVGGLWANKDRNGKTFLTGKLSPTVKVMIFPNQYRESENHPTHILYLAPIEQQSQRQGDEADEFFDEQSFQPGQAGASELRQAGASELRQAGASELRQAGASELRQARSQGGHIAPEDVPPLPEDEYTTVRRSQPRPQQRPGTGREAGF